jgi:hypothetical protein
MTGAEIQADGSGWRFRKAGEKGVPLRPETGPEAGAWTNPPVTSWAI